MPTYTLADLAERVGARVEGDSTIEVSTIATLASATSGQISFLSNSKYRSQLSETKASAVIIKSGDLGHCPCAALVMDNPYAGFARISQLLDTTPKAADSIAPSASISSSAQLGHNVSVGHNSVIEDGVVIGDNVQIGAGCFIGKNARIGQGTKLWANVTVYHESLIGEHCLFQSGAVIGSDGFGYANDAGNWLKIPQLGRVVIGNNTEIGANTCIDRGALDDTVIGDGVIIDNLCQIAHNVVIGDHTAIAGCTVIAGSSNIGKYCVIAGMVGINGHIEVADKVTFTGFAMVTKDIKEPGVYSSGIPVMTNREWRKSMVALRNLDSLKSRIKALEESGNTPAGE